jgi:hypothetical protein
VRASVAWPASNPAMFGIEGGGGLVAADAAAGGWLWDILEVSDSGESTRIGSGYSGALAAERAGEGASACAA